MNETWCEEEEKGGEEEKPKKIRQNGKARVKEEEEERQHSEGSPPLQNQPVHTWQSRKSSAGFSFSESVARWGRGSIPVWLNA